MKKQSIIYSDLSKKQLETLKELYIQKKVESMSHQELKQYVDDSSIQLFFECKVLSEFLVVFLINQNR